MIFVVLRYLNAYPKCRLKIWTSKGCPNITPTKLSPWSAGNEDCGGSFSTSMTDWMLAPVEVAPYATVDELITVFSFAAGAGSREYATLGPAIPCRVMNLTRKII